MAITYTATAFDSAGTATLPISYRDHTFSATSGDLLVAFGLSSDTTGSGDAVVTTQSGSTSSWTEVGSSNAAGSCGFVMSWATATGTGSVTIRATLPVLVSGDRVGVGVWVIPAAEWTGTPAYTAVPINDADGQASVTISATSTVLYGAADWSAAATGSAVTPAGGTIDTDFYLTSLYDAIIAHWTAQAAGTRNYGPSAPSGNDWGGGILVVAEPATGSDSGPNMAGAASALAGGSGSWVNASNATGAANAAYAVWTAP